MKKRLVIFCFLPFFVFGQRIIYCSYGSGFSNVVGTLDVTYNGVHISKSDYPFVASFLNYGSRDASANWSLSAQKNGLNYSASGSSNWFCIADTPLIFSFVLNPGTNAPLNPTNINFKGIANGKNPFGFPCDVLLEVVDGDGNVIQTQQIDVVSPGSDWSTSIDGFPIPAGAADFRFKMKPSNPVTGDGSALVMGSDGYLLQELTGINYAYKIYGGDEQLVGQGSNWNDSEAREAVVQASGVGSPTRQVEAKAVISQTPFEQYAPAVNTIVNGSSGAQSMAAGTAAAIDLSGVVKAVNGVGDKVTSAGQGIENKLESLLGGSGGLGDTSLDDPTSGYPDKEQLTADIGSVHSKSVSIIVGLKDSLSGFFSLQFPAVTERQYIWNVNFGGGYSAVLDITPYQTIVDSFRSLVGWVLTYLFITFIFSITRKGIA